MGSVTSSVRMRVSQALALGLVLAQLPFKLLLFLFLNLANIIAPSVTFNLMRKMMSRGNLSMGKMEEKFKSTEDIRFFFSFDKIKMTTRKEIRDILKEAQVG